MLLLVKHKPNCNANEQQEDAQGSRQIHQGRLSNETQREQQRRRHKETTEQRQKTTALRINCPPSPSFTSHVFLVKDLSLSLLLLLLQKICSNCLVPRLQIVEGALFFYMHDCKYYHKIVEIA